MGVIFQLIIKKSIEVSIGEEPTSTDSCTEVGEENGFNIFPVKVIMNLSTVP